MNDITFLRLPDQAEDRQWAAEPPAHSLGGLARNTHRGVDASASERVSEPAINFVKNARTTGRKFMRYGAQCPIRHEFSADPTPYPHEVYTTALSRINLRKKSCGHDLACLTLLPVENQMGSMGPCSTILPLLHE